MTGQPHVPIRTCVGCGARAPQAALLRFSSTATGALALAGPRLLRGRSGYLHAHAACWERFASRGGPVRSLRRTVDKPRRSSFVLELKAAEQSAR